MKSPVRTLSMIRPLAAACLLVLVVGASAVSADQGAGATSRAWAIKVIVPGQPATGTRVLTAPGDNVAFDGAYAYPADGSIVSAASVTTSVSASSGAQPSAPAAADAESLPLVKGKLTAAYTTGGRHT